jgi:hypothetical protein
MRLELAEQRIGQGVAGVCPARLGLLLAVDGGGDAGDPFDSDLLRETRIHATILQESFR